jgi:hypothetical protein
MPQEYGYSLIRCGQFGLEWFQGFNMRGEPMYCDSAKDAQIWESRLHAESQALLLGCQRKAVRVSLWPQQAREILGEALSK